MAGARSRNCPSASNSRFTAIRSARNVFVAGCSFCLPLEVRAPATTVARCCVSRIGRARTMTLAILLESRSSPKLIEQVGELFLRGLVHDVHGRSRLDPNPCACRAVRRSGRKNRAPRCPAACSKLPGPPARRPGAASPAPEPPRRSSRNSRAPESPSLRIPSIARARFRAPARRDPSLPAARWSTAATISSAWPPKPYRGIQVRAPGLDPQPAHGLFGHHRRVPRAQR